MLETERSSDEALRQPTFARLYRGALKIDDDERKLQAAYIILLAGRLGLRTGEIQHVREAWIDWRRGEIAIPRHDPCGCKNCWIAAKQKAAADNEDIRQEIAEVIDEHEGTDLSEGLDGQIDTLLKNLTDNEEQKETDEGADSHPSGTEDRDPLKILYEERWQPKYERSARRVPFGYSNRLTAVIMLFFQENECLEITQMTMNNLVSEAAENAKGVDPEGITLRGLRATAATNYATIIRNPKVLQDVMGWTRIETAARYLRRAGGYTTDIIYHAFGNSELAPIMYPEESDTDYPLLTNPIPYQNEPWNPILYTPSERMNRAEEIATAPQQVIHPRSRNAPKDIPYDPTDHDILTHEDYSADIIERADGKLAYQRPTLDELFEQHERMREEDIDSDKDIRKHDSIKDWKLKELEREQKGENQEEDDSMFSFQGDVDPETFDPGPPLSERLETSDHPIVRTATETIGAERLSEALKSSRRNLIFLIPVFCVTGGVAMYVLTNDLFTTFVAVMLLITSASTAALLPILVQLSSDLKEIYEDLFGGDN